jgi:hypothetical protein
MGLIEQPSRERQRPELFQFGVSLVILGVLHLLGGNDLMFPPIGQDGRCER